MVIGLHKRLVGAALLLALPLQDAASRILRPVQVIQVVQEVPQAGLRPRSRREIADSLGISIKGVEYHITRILKALRLALKDFL